MTKEILTQWITQVANLDADADDFEVLMDAAMEKAAEFIKEPGLDLDIYTDLCNLQWLWKHLKHTDYDVGAGADESYPVIWVLGEILDNMLKRADGFYEFN